MIWFEFLWFQLVSQRVGIDVRMFSIIFYGIEILELNGIDVYWCCNILGLMCWNLFWNFFTEAFEPSCILSDIFSEKYSDILSVESYPKDPPGNYLYEITGLELQKQVHFMQAYFSNSATFRRVLV